jgi:DNA-binding LytR/AlgR family response regulator
MIRCIAIDDEPLALELIEAFCSRIPFIYFDRSFTKTSEAAKYLKKQKIDLLFLDISMPDISGIDFLKSIEEEVMVIFTTAYSEYAVEGFNLEAIDYLLKPIELGRFSKACDKANDYFELHSNANKTGNHLYVRSEYALVKIPFPEILYLETLEDYIKIHLIGKKPILTLMSMKKMMDRLPEKEFIRVHRSYIVPLGKIESVRSKTISLGVVDIPISAGYEKEFLNAYTK